MIAARVHATSDGIGEPYNIKKQYEYVLATSGPDGRFGIGLPEADTQVIAMAPGFGLGYLLKGQPIRLRAGDQPISGRLVDLEGRPAPLAKVRLVRVSLPLPGAGPPDGPESRGPGITIDGVPALPDGVVTDADGRFQIAGLGRDVRAELSISGPAVAFKRVEIDTSRSSRERSSRPTPRCAA